jgi:hypothetical protein
MPIEIYEECGIQRNVLSLHACTGVQQAIGPNYPLSFAKMLSSLNAFEISNIQKQETN